MVCAEDQERHRLMPTDQTLEFLRGLEQKGFSIESLRDLVEGRRPQPYSGAIFIDPNKPFIYDMAKKRWKLIEDISEPTNVVITDLGVVAYLKAPGAWMCGGEVIRRTRNGAPLGQRHVEYLVTHQEEVPEVYRKCYLAVLGTVWRDSRGKRRIPYLHWDDGLWCLGFAWLDDDWGSSGRVLCISRRAMSST